MLTGHRRWSAWGFVWNRLLAVAPEGLLKTDVAALLRRKGETTLPQAVWAGLFVGLKAFLRVLPSADAKVCESA